MKRVGKALGIVILILTISIVAIIGVNRYFKYQRDQQHSQQQSETADLDWNDRDGELAMNLTYGEGERNVYDLFIPAGLDTKEPQHVMLFIHGGAWTSGSKDAMYHFCETFAKKGYITATMNYSYLSNVDPIVTAATMTDEVGACIGALKTEVLERGYNVDGIALSGQSAGGHLTMLYAYGHAEESAIPIRFVFQQVGPSDFHGDTWGVDADMKTILHTGSALAGGISGLSGTPVSAKQLRNGDPAVEEAIAAISPASYVTNQTVPTLMAYGMLDDVVGTKQAEPLLEKFEEYGIDYRYIEYPNSGHSLDQDKDCTKAFYQAIEEFAKKYF